MVVKFANKFSDRHRTRMRTIKDMDALYAFLQSIISKRIHRLYNKWDNPLNLDWKISGDILMTQVKAVIGRYTPMGDDAFYPIYLENDNVVQRHWESSV